MLETKNRLVVSIGGVEITPDAIDSFYIVEGINIPFPICHVSFGAFKEFNFVTGVQIGAKFSVFLNTGNGDESIVECDFEVFHCREHNTGNSKFSVIGVGCSLSNLNAIRRRAFVNMTSKDALLSLYEEDSVFDDVIDLTNDDVSFSDNMTWLQKGTWVQMWNHIMSHSFVAENDSILAFSGIDGDAVVTTIRTAFSDKNPQKITFNKSMQGDYGFGYDMEAVFFSLIRDTNPQFFNAVGRYAFNIIDTDTGENDFRLVEGVEMFGEDAKGKAIPVSPHVIDGTYKTETMFQSPNTHPNYALAKVVNQRMSDTINGNVIMITAYPHPNIRIGELVQIVGDEFKDSTRFNGNWLVIRIFWDLAENGYLCHLTLSKPTINVNDIDLVEKQ